MNIVRAIAVWAVMTAPVLCNAQRYENLAMEGGGIRGIAYAGALSALEEQGVATQIRKVAGTSIGGLVAVLFAVGYTAQELQDILADLNVKQFNDGGWLFIGGQYRFRKKYGWYHGDRLEDWTGRLIQQKTGSAHTTFRELRSLAEKDRKFRDAYLVATDLTGQKSTVFCADSFSGMELKTAVRASLSIPLYFTAVLLDKDGNRFKSQKSCPACHVFVDGGILMNYPIALFDSNQIPNPKTLGLKLERVAQMPMNDEGGEIAAFPVKGIKSYIGAFYNLCIEGLNRKRPFEEEKFRTIYISTSDIGPRVRHISMAQKQSLYKNGYDAALRFLK